MTHTVIDWRVDPQRSDETFPYQQKVTYESAVASYLAAASHEMRYPTDNHQRPSIMYLNDYNPVIMIVLYRDISQVSTVSKLLFILVRSRKSGTPASELAELVRKVMGTDLPVLPARPLRSNLEIVLYIISWLIGLTELPLIPQGLDPRVIEKALEYAIKETLESHLVNGKGAAFFQRALLQRLH